MGFIDYFSWFVLLVTVTTLVAVFVFMGLLPGLVARQRSHPQADAIKIASWVTLLTGFVLWPLVLIWAYIRPTANENIASQAATQTTQGENLKLDISQKITELETRIAQLELHQGASQ